MELEKFSLKENKPFSRPDRWIVGIYFLFLYFNFVLAQPWLAMIPISKQMSLLIFFITASLSLFLWKYLVREGHPINYLTFKEESAGFPLLSLWICFACAIMYWIWPLLHFPLHTWGDEDHHFYVTQELLSYLRKLWTLHIPESEPPGYFRYPILVNFFESPFLLASSDILNQAFWQRLSSLIFVIPLSVFFLFQKKNLKIFSFLILSSPLLLAYITDKYLDIAHPLFVFFAFWSLWNFLKNQKNSDAIFSCIFGSMAFFSRDNIFPTSFLLFFSLSTVWIFSVFRQSTSGASNYSVRFFNKDSLLLRIFLLGFLPCLISMILKKLAPGNMDGSRLSFHFLSEQNYFVFFQSSIFYLPWIPIFILLPWSWKKLSKPSLYAVIIAVLSFGAQLFLYGLFQPGWMPWSRNYLMFYGQILFIAWILSDELQGKTFKWLTPLALLIQVGFQLTLFPELKNNILFHENEIIYNYPAVFHQLSHNRLIKECPEVVANVPLSKSESWRRAESLFPPKIKFTILRQLNQEPRFQNFKDFMNEVNEQKVCLLYHYRKNITQIPFLSSNFNAERPDLDSLKNFEVLIDFIDPISQGRNGILLLKPR